MNEISGILRPEMGRFPSLEIKPAEKIGESPRSFSELLSEAVGQVDKLGKDAGKLQIDLALGKPVEMHQVMLAATKASIALELMIELRNKVIEAYQEISRMPV